MADSKRYGQALEGDHAIVDATIARIKADGRHRAVVMLDRCTVVVQKFDQDVLELKSRLDGNVYLDFG